MVASMIQRKTQKCKYAAKGCDFKHDWPASLGKHESVCDFRPKTKSKNLAVATPVEVKPPVTATQVVQAMDVQAATAIVLAAKFPKGIKPEEYLRVVRLIQAVEHG